MTYFVFFIQNYAYESCYARKNSFTHIGALKAYLVLEKGLSFINENQNYHCEYMFCV